MQNIHTPNKVKTHTVFIPGNVPSSKNSRITNRKTGKSFPSALVQGYRKRSLAYWLSEAEGFRRRWDTLNKPWPVYMGFVRKDHRTYDWVNPTQTVCDEMTKHGWVKDDDVANMIPFPMMVNTSWHF